MHDLNSAFSSTWLAKDVLSENKEDTGSGANIFIISVCVSVCVHNMHSERLKMLTQPPPPNARINAADFAIV